MRGGKQKGKRHPFERSLSGRGPTVGLQISGNSDTAGASFPFNFPLFFFLFIFYLEEIEIIIFYNFLSLVFGSFDVELSTDTCQVTSSVTGGNELDKQTRKSRRLPFLKQ